ncbi:phage major capsid protein [Paenarthrobacter sp. C1]|uniref:phage major capsid protein n=1 Tax=Paenarthrobacter sp. C1 TaxID=3400220 RepID=UPI003BF5B4CC
MPYNNIISRTDASALIPEEVSTEVFDHLHENSAALTLFKQRRMSRGQQRLPVKSALPTAYFVNGDTGLKQTTEVNWDNKYLNVEEIAAIVPIPEAVLDDADFDVWAEIKPDLQEAIGRALDAAVFFGTNKPASWPAAIVAGATAAGNVAVRGTSNAAAGGIAGDLSTLYGLVEDDGYDVNGLIASRSLKGRLRNARATDGQTLNGFSQTDVYGIAPSYPLRGLWPTGVSAAEAVAGDFSRGIIGIRRDLTYKVLTEAVIQDNAGAIIYNLAQQDMVALRVVFRVAFATANPINFDKPTEAERYPFAVLTAPGA